MPLFAVGGLSLFSGWSLLINLLWHRYAFWPAWALRAYNRIFVPALLMTLLGATFG